MVQQSLIDYIKTLLTQGYSGEVIKSTLLNAGYSSYDVDEAFKAVYSPKKVHTKFLVLLFLLFFIMLISGIVLFKLFQSPPVVLNFSVRQITQEVVPGSQIVLTAEIVNPGNTKTYGLVDISIIGPEGKLVSKTEEFSVVDKTSIPFVFDIPKNVAQGAYRVDASISSGKTMRKTEKESKFLVTAPKLQTPQKQAPSSLPQVCSNCDDLDFCTTDTCIEGSCIHKPIAPCCGDRQCSNGETENSCSLDCSSRPVTPFEIKSQAKLLAVTDIQKAIKLCNSLAQQPYVDDCLNDVSETSKNKDACLTIASNEIRDACYIQFVYANDFAVCSKIVNRAMRNSCTSLAQVSSYK